MKNKILIGLLILLFPTIILASEFTTNYNLEIPAIASKDWQPAISQDIISIDAVLKMISQDSSFIDGGTNIYLRTTTDSVNIGGTTPLTKLEVIGYVSADGIRLDSQGVAGSPDTATLKGGALYMSADGSLNFYNGSAWRKITVE